ncbi:unnamed protein product [Aphanomyces euteiches]
MPTLPPVTTLAPKTTTCANVQEDTDYEGHDFAYTKRASPEECCADCQSGIACKVVVWYDGTCYLKRSIGKKISAPGRKAYFACDQPSTCSALEEKNADYTGHNIGSVVRGSADLCCADWQANPACKFFVWYQNVCYVKSSAGEKVSSRGRIAGYASPSSCSAIEKNTDYQGNDIKAVGDRSTPDLCWDDCKATPGCQLFVWFESVCYLKRAKGLAINKPGAAAGFASLTLPTCAAVGKDTDFGGNDLDKVPTLDVGGCCDAYSWTQDGWCYMKQDWPTNSTSKSGVHTGRDVEYVGNDMKAFAKASPAECCVECRMTLGCRAFFHADGVCYLKSGKGETIAKAGVTSAITSNILVLRSTSFI